MGGVRQCRSCRRLSHADAGIDATFTIAGSEGERAVEASEFFKDLLTTALESDEVLTSITVPAYGKMPGMGGVYLKHRHPASSYAVVGVAAMVGLSGGKVARAAVVVGGITANPRHAAAVESALAGMEPTEANIASAAEKMDVEATMGDSYASAEYRAHLAKVMAKRALMLAANALEGECSSTCDLKDFRQTKRRAWGRSA
jgi:carbon-monoxide dehydrogenase medium subunit